jgi:hypothetical protein
MTTRNGDEAPRELGWRGSFCLGCGIGLVVLLAVGLLVFWRGKKIEGRKRDATLHELEIKRRGLRPVPADGSGGDWTGQKALGNEKPVEDGWGNPLRYRCPGPVHRNGWDLWSCGPNGKDDQGTFDDILIGEDIAAVSTK